MTAAKRKSKPEVIQHKCDFCKKSFVTERTLLAHSCERKQRWLWKDEKYAMMAFRAYQLFYQIAQRSKKPKTQEEFIGSNYYLGFIKFGKYLMDINAIEPVGFIEFLIRSDTKLADWSTPKAYEIWIRELSKKEHPMKAYERNVLLMEQWARETGEDWTDFFRLVSPSLATKWIKSGRISPWLLYTVGDALIERLSDEQLAMVKDLIEPDMWFKKFELYEEELRIIRTELRSVGV